MTLKCSHTLKHIKLSDCQFAKCCCFTSVNHFCNVYFFNRSLLSRNQTVRQRLWEIINQPVTAVRSCHQMDCFNYQVNEREENLIHVYKCPLYACILQITGMNSAAWPAQVTLFVGLPHKIPMKCIQVCLCSMTQYVKFKVDGYSFIVFSITNMM